MFYANESGHFIEANKISGIWYWIYYNIVPEGYFLKEIIDDDGNIIKKSVFQKIQMTDVVSGYTSRSGEYYRSSKIQISNKYLKKHGLVNDNV